ncbi:MAG TPA: pyridoxamine 5'-phosphate oxidase family protein [Chloroflexota bacterium]|nr:pyridoxamine 5'-phosphate oxidase family protein [Chloroflexota bacterium]
MAESQHAEAWRGKIGQMSDDEVAAFVAGKPVCKLGCLDDEGWPYVVPCWFESADDGYYIIPRERSAWARYLRRDGRVFLCIDEAGPPQRRLMIKGSATIVEEPNVGGKWVEIARRMSIRYLGEHGPDYLEPTMAEPRWLVFVTPLRTTTWQGVGWHQRYKHH